MPTYAFKCITCPQTITITSPMGEVKRPKCLNCQTDMVRDYSFSGVQFKGSGFYSKEKND